MIERFLEKLIRSENLSVPEMVEVTTLIMDGKASPAQIGSFLTALRLKGETVDEITGAALVMREKSLKVNFQAPTLIDTCGTGGDGANTFNISTTVAFVVAAAGVPVAKHGNRAVSSRCGSADLLDALGVKVDLSPEKVEKCLKQTGIGFMFAPVFHLAMKHAIGPRRELGFRTIFNLLGPLTNPAQANCQLIGVYHSDLTVVIAEVLKKLGIKRAMVVHGGGGLDELSLENQNKVSFLKNGIIETYTFAARDFGLEYASNEALIGFGSSENAAITEGILKGEISGPKLDVVLLNAGAALYVADLVTSLGAGIERAAEIIKEGYAYERLNQLRQMAV